MKDFIKIISLLLFPCMLWAQEVQVLVKIHSIEEIPKAVGYPIRLEKSGLREQLKTLSLGDEVILKGTLEYSPVTQEGKKNLHPTFHILSIHPISLSRLGEVDRPMMVTAPVMTFKTQDYSGGTPLRASSGLTGSLILTASFLMLQNLSSGDQSVNRTTDDLNRGLIFSAGLLATTYFLWEQLTHNKVP